MALVICDSNDLPKTAAEHIARALVGSLLSRRPTSLAVAGGNTPRAAYALLAEISGIDWGAVRVFFGDERGVPPDHSDSNYRMVDEALFRKVSIPPENVLRMPAEVPDREAAARAYAALLPDVIDVMVLGIGEDGHTASLFPGDPAVRELERKVLAVEGKKPPPQRLTLGPRMISGARARIVLAAGAGKAEPLARALEGAWDPPACPAQLARDSLWIVDRAAASRLAQPG